MAFVVELISRSGRVIERSRFSQAQCTIGRGYDNDLILSDPYVGAHHARIVNDLEGMAVEVLDGEAHTQHGSRTIGAGRCPLQSGAKLVLGRTHIRVVDVHHPVEPTLAFERFDDWFAGLAQPGALLLLGALYLAIAFGSGFLTSYTEQEPARVLVDLMGPLGMMLAWALLWSLVTRVSRGEPRFMHHLVAALLAATVSLVFDLIIRVVAFNTGDTGLATVLGYLGAGITLVLLLSLSLRAAFRQSVWVRRAFAHGTAWALVGFTALSTVSFVRDFSAAPDFESTVLPVWLRVVEPLPAETFVKNSEQLFEFAAEPAE